MLPERGPHNEHRPIIRSVGGVILIVFVVDKLITADQFSSTQS